MSKQVNPPEEFLERPPVVAVLGHVDCGKTTLLDRIRKTQVVAREAGGITQSIGAYQIDFKGQKITFIDTPGHAAFAQMRARGGQVADLVILVVAADDGVMPQTLESLEHIKAASVPFLVAINKIDLTGVDLEKVKKQLADNGVLLEGYGGEVVTLPISAKTGQGLEELLEMIVLLAQMEEIKASPTGPLQAVVIESKKGKAGPAATVIVKNGTLSIGDQIGAGEVLAKVRGLVDENGKRLTKVGPGKPAEVIGFETLPPVGVKITRVQISPKPKVVPPSFLKSPSLKEGERKLKIILKADSVGSLEAVLGNLPAEVLLIYSSIGDISESDVLLARTTGAKIFGFRVKLSSNVAKLAESEKVKIKTQEIIYQFLEDLEKEVLETQKLPEEEVLGKAEIIAEFLVEGLRVAGCRVIEGKIDKADNLKLKRGEKLIGETKISSMKKKKEAITEAKLKEEFGAILDPPLDFKIGDLLISFKPIKESANE